MERKCKDCGCSFTLTDSEIKFYEGKGMQLPKRCSACRDLNRIKKTKENTVSKANSYRAAENKNRSGNMNNRTSNSGGKNNKIILGAIIVFLILGVVAYLGSKLIGNNNPAENSGSEVTDYGYVTDNNDVSYVDDSDTVTTGTLLTEDDNTSAEENSSEEIIEEVSDGENTDAAGLSDGTSTEGASTEGTQASSETTNTDSANTENTTVETNTTEATTTVAPQTTNYYFRNDNLLTQHYEKHGIEMGFASKEDYQAAASAVINNPEALNKTESEDGDYVYYVESTNEFVILSTDGYIRTYFNPSSGKAYYDRQ